MADILHWDLRARAEAILAEGRPAAGRRALWTGAHAELFAASLAVGESTDEAVHDDADQVVTFVTNGGQVVVDGEERLVAAGDVVAVPAGVRHRIVNVGRAPLILYTVSTPPGRA